MKNNYRYKFSPQLKIYDKIYNSWHPYVMFKQPQNINNKVFSTDRFGMRYTVDGNDNEKYSLFDLQNKRQNNKQIAIVGGSTAFGVGATNDIKTISSYLTSFVDYDVFNLGFRAFNHFQELIMFQQVFHKFNNLKYVIFISGFNDIFFSKFVQSSENNIPFYFESEFNYRMNYPQNSIFKNLLHKILPKDYSNRVDWINDNNKKIFQKIFKKIPKINQNIKNSNWKIKYERNFNIWKALSEALNFKVIFALQPFINWTNKELSEEEKLIVNEIKENNSDKVLQALNSISKKDHIDATNFFKNICSKNQFEFIDMNNLMNIASNKKKWFFVDSVHLNDNGYSELSNDIIKLIND